MTYSKPALSLRKPKVIELPRLSDRISYLYLEYCQVQQGSTGVVAVQDGRSVKETLVIPIASLSFILLGPGTSISTPAAISLHRAGTTVVYSSLGGATGFAAATPLTGRGDWAQAQARAWADRESRLTLARTLYSHQFPDLELEDDLPLKVLRGIEGAQIKSLYKRLAAKERLGSWRRESNSEKQEDAVNPLLNLGSAILYGAAASAVSALGLNTALGFIHSGAMGALLFDLADIHKPRASIPLAFACHKREDPATAMRSEMRSYLYKHNVTEGYLQLLTDMLTPYLEDDTSDTLLDDKKASVPGHTNYAADEEHKRPLDADEQ